MSLEKKIITSYAVMLVLLMTVPCTGCQTTSASSDAGDSLIQDTTVGQNTTITIPSDKSDNAQRLMRYIADVWEGGKCIAGQQDLTWKDSVDMLKTVYKDTGRYPAISGFDFMNYTRTSSGTSGKSQTEEALAWWNGTYTFDSSCITPVNKNVHGIVTFCWHWRAPTGTAAEFYTAKNAFSIPYDADSQTWNTSSDDYTAMIADLDVIAAELQKLKDAGCPVLWRPLHEASGGWFWWGQNKVKYLALYKLMHNYFTNTKGLDNLIWVWNGEDASWYPGDKYVDIVAADVYDLSVLDSKYSMLINVPESGSGTKIAALSENGSIPSRPYGTSNWAYFVTWNDSSDPDDDTESGDFWSNTKYNTLAHRKEIYNNTNIITFDELPDLTSY